MEVDKVFISVNAKDFANLSDWWSRFLERKWDREPMPNCHEWDVAECVLFQILDNADVSGSAVITFHVAHLDDHIARLRKDRVEAPDPVKVQGFATLRYCKFHDPEGNEIGLLDGA